MNTNYNIESAGNAPGLWEWAGLVLLTLSWIALIVWVFGVWLRRRVKPETKSTPKEGETFTTVMYFSDMGWVTTYTQRLPADIDCCLTCSNVEPPHSTYGSEPEPCSTRTPQ